jgi:cell division septal protein FtsQ
VIGLYKRSLSAVLYDYEAFERSLSYFPRAVWVLAPAIGVVLGIIWLFSVFSFSSFSGLKPVLAVVMSGIENFQIDCDIV